ncbi:beta-ketoacyl synthase [Actinidia rufa]|uniref:beta-ketoacyl-[acyl-carrier-protein] synthase I n=1 Tax=Actinidia rufa TaxID=165716 RepID=A0A7J0FFW2_9ERIC|nr:beta-ketoacyl synthase [Actinidia rufa]
MARRYWPRLFPSRFLFNRFISSSSAFKAFDPPPSVPHRRVVVTGLGLVTPLGCGVESTWKRLIEGECGVRAITSEDLKMSGFDKETRLHTFDQLSSKVAATVPCGTNSGEFNDAIWLNPKEHRSISRFIGYALCATNEALRCAKWIPTEQAEKEKTGVSIGGGIGSISDITGCVANDFPFFIPRMLINMAAGHVSMKYGFQGPNHAVVTACATGGHSIGDAARMVQFGDADVMVAGGTESSIDALSIAGFCRSRALSTKYNSTPEQASRPFDCGRDGFVIGEGSGILVLESGLRPDQVDYVNAHATSTPLGDTVEANAIRSVFSEHATSGALALSSTKFTKVDRQGGVPWKLRVYNCQSEALKSGNGHCGRIDIK